MSSYARYRDLHLWVGLILLIPVGVVATTGFLWNHEKSLGIKQEYKKDKPGKHTGESNAALALAGNAWQQQAPAIEAALRSAQAEWGGDVSLERIELRNEPGYGLVVKVKAPKEAGLAVEEIVWSVAEERVLERKGEHLESGGRDWSKLVHDLHTGKFFSHHAGWLWSDSAAMAILFLGLTGVVLYLIPVFKKRAQRRRAARNEKPAPAASEASTQPATA